MTCLSEGHTNKVNLDFSRQGKPTDNPFIESFNGSLRDECLNVNWFPLLEYAQNKLDEFREEFNTFRPHRSLNDSTPLEFKKKHPNQ